MSGLWRDHSATPHQRQLQFTPKRKRRSQPTQADLLIEMLRTARANQTPLSLPEIMGLGIAQHGARFKEIRDRGFRVENVMERKADGAVHSWYWLRFDPERDGAL